MGTITERKRADGSTAYLAQIAVRREGKSVRESQTFDRAPAARAWIKRREEELAQPGAVVATRDRDPTLADVIDKFIASSIKDMGKTQAQVLRSIKSYPLAKKRASTIKSSDIVEFAEELLAGDRQPSTVQNYLSHLAPIFAVAMPAWNIPLDYEAIRGAQKVARRLGITAKSRKRSRRPTLDELDLILTHYEDQKRWAPQSLPMVKLVLFAMFSTRRLEEITRLRWSTYQREGAKALVTDMKHPGAKIGNDIWVELPAYAVALIETMPHKSEFIFPFNGESISTSFTRTTAFLGIADLHFHDLRHEGISWLFELGKTIPQAASVSGHKSWSALQRYAHLAQIGDKYADWPWLKRLGLIKEATHEAE